VRVQERLESSPAGRAVISGFVVVTLLALVFWNLPDSEIKHRALKVVRPYITALSIDQNWGVFSPDPRRESVELIARVEYADGSEETLGVPRGGDFVGAYWDYRWRKWMEWTRSDSHPNLWDQAARWFARVAARGGGQPVRVTLVRRWYDVLPPGPGPERTDWREFAYYTLSFTDTDGSG
jgi:hypothetical protein